MMEYLIVGFLLVFTAGALGTLIAKIFALSGPQSHFSDPYFISKSSVCDNCGESDFLKQKKIYDFTPGKASITTLCGFCGEVLDIGTSIQDSINLRYVKSPYQAYVEAMFGLE